jgi:hypothetical protein
MGAFVAGAAGVAGQYLVPGLITEGRGARHARAGGELGGTPAYPSWRDGVPVWAGAFTPGQAP